MVRTLASYDPKTHFLVPSGQSIFDPMVFGKFDLKTQKVVPKGSQESPLHHFDLIAARANRWISQGHVGLNTDRYDLILDLLPEGKGKCIDACTASPETRVSKRVSSKGYEYQAIDLNGDGRLSLKENLTCLSFADSSIQVVMSLDTLEHIPDWPKAVQEIYRILKTDGFVLVNVPCYYFERRTGEPIQPGVDPWDHTRYFSVYEFIDEFEKCGFIFLRIQFQMDFGSLICVMTKNGLVV